MAKLAAIVAALRVGRAGRAGGSSAGGSGGAGNAGGGRTTGQKLADLTIYFTLGEYALYLVGYSVYTAKHGPGKTAQKMKTKYSLEDPESEEAKGSIRKISMDMATKEDIEALKKEMATKEKMEALEKKVDVLLELSKEKKKKRFLFW